MAFVNLTIKPEIGVGIISINRPEAMNALNVDVLAELQENVDFVAKDERIRVCIITGEGKAFVAGADIAQMAKMTPAQAEEFASLGSGVFSSIENMGKPVIAAINGFALGGGCELALACDIRLASEKAKLGQPEVGLGITPGFGGTQRLARAISPAKAKELIFTGKIIDANEAQAIGLVNHVYPVDALMDEACKLASEIAKKAPVALMYSKRAINEGVETDLTSGLELEKNLFSQCFSTADQKEGMEAFLAKRAPEYKGK